MATTDSSTTFSLANQSLKFDTADSITPHLAPLQNSTSQIKTIKLNGNSLGVPAAEVLAPLLASQTSLQTANLSDLFTGRLLSEIPSALSALLTALAKCPNLETIDLSDNAFGLNLVEPLVVFLRQHVPLRHLILNNNGLGPIAGTKIADALSELAQRKEEARQKSKDGGDASSVPQLETVVCGRNRLESGSMKAWAKAYTANKGVKTVRMVQNGIRPEGIVSLLRDGLGNCEELEVLDLQDNTFTRTGSKALVDVLGRWKDLKELCLGDAYLSAKGGVMLGEELAKGKNGELQVLKLQYNEMTASSLARIVGAVKAGGLDKLRRCELNGNKLSEDDENLTSLRELLEERKEAQAADEAEDDSWGIDDLSDLEEDSDEEEEDDDDDDDDDDKADEDEEDDDDEREVKAERVLKDADEEEAENVAQKKDKSVDDLADALGKTVI